MVPYAAYKLVRVMRLFELPCDGWKGWHMHSGRLWSPEGHGFIPSDSSWWGLLVRRSALFGEMYQRDRQMDALLQRLRMGGNEGAQTEPDRGGGRELPRGGSGCAASSPTGEAGRAAKPSR